MKIKNLRKIYKTKGNASVEALKGISFDLPERGMFFILGKSGSGKSTLLNIMSGLDKADEGSLEICGKNLQELSFDELATYRNTYCGFVFQEYNLIPELNVKENIALALELQGEKQVDKEVSRVLEIVELGGYENRSITTLSGGEKQRVAIARAIIKNPQIIFADEPTGALDEKTGETIFNLLKELSREKLIVVVTHDRDFAERYGERIIELADGQIKANNGKEAQRTNESNHQKWHKSRLPVKTAIKIGCSNFKYHPIRFVTIIILAVVAFTFFGFSLNASLNRYQDIVYKSLKNSGVTCTSIKKFTDDSIIIPIKEDEKQNLDKELSNTIGIVYSPIEIDFEKEVDSVYYSIVPSGFTEISLDQINSFGFTLIGSLPEKKNQIALTMFTAEIVNELNFFEAKVENIIGNALIINGSEYLISALIDTNFDWKRFSLLKSEDEISDNNLMISFENELTSAPHNLLYVSDIDDYTDEDLKIDAELCSLLLQNLFDISVDSVKRFDSSLNVLRLNDKTDGNFVSAELLPLILRTFSCDVEYKGNNYNNYGVFFDVLCEEIKESVSESVDYRLKAFEKYKDEFDFPVIFNCTFLDKRFNSLLELEIDGFYAQDDDLNTVYVNNIIFNEQYKKIGGKYDALIVSCEGKAIKNYIKKDGDFRLDNYVINNINSSLNSIESFKKIFYILSLFFGLFSIILLLNFFFQSFSDKTKTIGILKAGGCSNANLIKIFLIEGLVIGCIVLILSIVSTIIISLTLNSYFGILAIFALNPLTFPLMSVLILFFSVFGCFFTIVKLSRFMPNDIIRRI